MYRVLPGLGILNIQEGAASSNIPIVHSNFSTLFAESYGLKFLISPLGKLFSKWNLDFSTHGPQEKESGEKSRERRMYKICVCERV